MMQCVFCQIIKNEIPRKVVFEDEEILVFPTNKPMAETHVLIVPKIHLESLTVTDEAHKNILGKMQLIAAKMVQDLKITTGYKIILNGGRYQEVPHIHYHLLGGNMKGGEN